ncbi:MAG: UbiA family prenyltransferase [Planctomycetales bacterium]
MQALLPYLRLCRLAAVFTALADILLGFVLTHAGFSPGSTLGWLLISSAGLYLAGMVFNDVFDREQDARDRPGRPIPSGQVSCQHAVWFGTVLLLVGGAAACLAGLPSALVAGMLIANIFLYNGFLKSTPLGPLAMGGCRFLNVMLGASAAIDPTDGRSTLQAVWMLPQTHVAAALGTYITGVTWFAQREEGTSNRWHLAGAMGVVNLGLVLLAGFVLHWPTGDETAARSWNSALLLGALGVIINRRLANALFDPRPQTVQQGVRLLLMSLVLLDATIVFFVTGRQEPALGVALLLIPALLLSRVLAVT